MTLREFLHRFLWHFSAAAGGLFVVLLIGESFVPGSVLPFVDLVDMGMVLIGVLVVLILVPEEGSVKQER